jgi:transcription elongation GreA/GreB family factor
MIDGETVAGLRSELSAREARIEELRDRLESAEAAREELESERDRLRERVSELERRLEESGAAPAEDRRELPPAEALSGTSILVRYRSKGEPTLADVHDGRAKRDALAGNLTLEPHPSFDTEGVSVGGRTYDAFIEGTRGYGFLRWLVGEFPYEIRDTESTAALKPLWDALPALDRAEFDAAVTIEAADRETARFDLVGRDRRGNPLLVALLESDRAPTDAGTMSEFLRDATAAAESHESLVGAFAVTASYFEPEALETAQQATGGSLLSRSKRRSFVKTSRKGGYHLCLVEDRQESFYLSEPDL